MGNICSIAMPCDAMATRCWDDCIRGKAMYACNLEDNVVALERALRELKAKRDDVLTRVNIAEGQRLKRLNEVQVWISSVEVAENEAAKLLRDSPQEISSVCLGGCCSKNCKSTYKFGKKVAQKLMDMAALMNQGDFKEVAARFIAPGFVRPTQPTIGLDSTFHKVWSCIEDEKMGVIGLYGTGGVGKTTLLKQINNKFFGLPNIFDFVIWVVVSRDLNLEKIQEDIGKRIGFPSDMWNSESIDEKAADIFRVLSSRKFILLLDDVWERFDLSEVGIPIPSESSGSKIIFTTRSFEVCGLMEADKKIKLECLAPKEALQLFLKKVGEETLGSHPKIPELAEIVAKECDGLPLALITVARAMACKRTLEEWNFAIEVLRRAASEFPGMGKEVHSRLKFSYDNLPNETTKSCFLYCSLFPEDFLIYKNDLIDYWICEGFLNDYDDKCSVRNLGYDIIGTLINSCLLEEEGNLVKMHDVIRDVSLWIANYQCKKGEKFLVRAGAQLTKSPEVERLEEAKRVSLMANGINSLTEIPKCSNLLTLFLQENRLEVIASGFFQFMHSLKVLDLSYNYNLTELPPGISNLVSLEYLNLEMTGIEELPIDLKTLANLKYLNFERTWLYERIPCQLISSFQKLQVFKAWGYGFPRKMVEESDLSGDELSMVDELLALKHLNSITITLISVPALRKFLSSQKLRRYTRALCLYVLNDLEQLNASSLTNVKNLEILSMRRCEILKELKLDRAVQRRVVCFDSLRVVELSRCPKLRELTWLILAPNLTRLYVFDCDGIEEVTSAKKLSEVTGMVRELKPFDRLEVLHLESLPELKSIHGNPLAFPCLDHMEVLDCGKLKKLPLNSSSASKSQFVIFGSKQWWEELEWEDEATRNTFLNCFKESTSGETKFQRNKIIGKQSSISFLSM